MIEKQPYEKHLSDQLEKLPPIGDAQTHWPAMKALLDRELPKGGGFSNWWKWGSLLLLISVAIWWIVSPGNNNKSSSSSIVSAGATSEKKEGGSSPSITDPPQGETNSNNGIEAPVEEVSAKENTAQGSTKDPLISTPSIPKKEEIKVSKNTVIIAKNNNSKSDEAVSIAADLAITKNKNNGEAIVKTSKQTTSRIKRTASIIAKGDEGVKEKNSTKNTSISPVLIAEDDLRSSSVYSALDQTNFFAYNTGLLLTSPIDQQYSATISDRKNPIPKPSRFKAETERTKKLSNREVGSGNSKKLIFGLALPLSFPISDQKAVAYNFNGGQNTVSDYLPTPNMQYHFGKESFLQAEVQVFNPQFIRPALLYQSTQQQMISGNSRYVTTSIFAKKLYYFNIPVSIYYSPFKNFYLGSGLQFSTLMNGIAYSEYRAGYSMFPQSTDSLMRYSYSKFRSDTLSSRLNGNEFRLLLDAQYYWKRFAVGMRYNQGLGNYINLQVSPNMPNVVDRNRTLQFYLRYSLWSSRY